MNEEIYNKCKFPDIIISHSPPQEVKVTQGQKPKQKKKKKPATISCRKLTKTRCKVITETKLPADPPPQTPSTRN
jgi:hypothetical protein